MERPPPKVFKVKDPEQDEKYKSIHPHLPQLPALVLVVGSVKQGKSNLLVNICCNPEFGYNTALDSIIIMKQQNQKEIEKLQEEYGDMFPNIFMDLYNKAIGDAPYSFLYLDLQTNPASAYIRFETKIAEGSTKLF